MESDKLENSNKSEESTIHVEIDAETPSPTPVLSRDHGSNTFFEPHREPSPGSSSDRIEPRRNVTTPEKKLTLFALRLAVLEKAASALGTLAFILATVVLLGGFAIFIGRTDFWVVTVILVSEGTRIFSRSHEIEWQHQSTWTLASVSPNSFRLIRSSSGFLWHTVKAFFNHKPEHDEDRQIRNEDATDAQEFQKKLVRYQTMRAWYAPEVPLFQYSGWVFLSKNISRWLSWLQLVSAFNCIGLSLYRLIVQDYGEVDKEEKHNRAAALNLFYSLALAEATLFLLEKIYWTYKISHRKLLDNISTECDLGSDGLITIRQFFYDAYSRCIEGSIFDGIRMDLVSFAEELLDSSFLNEQLIAVRILLKLVRNESSSFETVRKIGTNVQVIERLVEMLNWKASEDQEIRKAAAEILSELAGKRHTALRVAGIPGAMESISSLLLKDHPDSSYDYSGFNLIGLLMLKRLAREHDNCFKIGNARGLLPRVIDFTSDVQKIFFEPVSESGIKTMKRSLKVLKMLVETTGSAGKILRKEISNIVHTISNMRKILECGVTEIKLQRLAIEILTGLAMDETAKERIASTGGVIKLLFSIFLSPSVEGEFSVRTEAGEAIAMLALESKRNSCLILKKVDVSKLVEVLGDQYLSLNALRILRNLCTYSGDECKSQLERVVVALPFVLETTMDLKKRDKILEGAIGLTYEICKLAPTPDYFITELGRAQIPEEKYAEILVKILRRYEHPSIEVPRIRRFLVQQATWMMKHHRHFIKLFKEFGMVELLEHVGDTTSDLECFHVFSGSAGISQHRELLSALVNEALEILYGGSCHEQM